MTVNLKRRLAGAVAVLIIALVFFPLVFDGAGYQERQLEPVIPPAPVIPELVQIEPVNPVIIESVVPAPPAEAVVVPAPAVEIAEPLEQLAPTLNPVEDTPVLDADQVPAAWTLQLASFKQEENARGLRNKLIEAGYKVYIRQGTDLVRVYVGPDMQRSRLEALQAQLKQEYGLDGIIVRFTTQ